MGRDRDRLRIFAQPAGLNRADLGMKGSERPLDKRCVTEVHAPTELRTAGSKSIELQRKRKRSDVWLDRLSAHPSESQSPRLRRLKSSVVQNCPTSASILTTGRFPSIRSSIPVDIRQRSRSIHTSMDCPHSAQRIGCVKIDVHSKSAA
jgi:hypothetical protein